MNYLNFLLVKLLFIYSLITNNSAISYSFSEELLIEVLPNSNAHFNFQFKSVWQNDLKTNINYDLFPKRLGDIVSKFQIDELSLKLSQGTWKYVDWGLPSLGAPSGSELWTVFNKNVSDKAVDINWLHSSRAISGLFGLSINLEENPNTVNPKYSIKYDKGSSNLRYASIPNEIVCTENFTPWIKLLPCGKNKGLAQLFKNAPKLFESHYFMSSLNFRKICMDESCSKINFELKQTLSLVYNVDILKRQLDSEESNWSFNDVFQNKINSVCPAADLTNVYMNLGANGKVTVQPSERLTNEKLKNPIYVYDLKKILTESRDFNPSILQKRSYDQVPSSYVSLHRYITDKNEVNFGIKTLIKNDHSKDVTIIYFDTIPWYFRVYINSLIIKNEDENRLIKSDSTYFVPGLDRQRPHQIEIKLKLKPKTVYSIYIKADFAYLKWDEYPPDVNHGFYINPALITVKLENNLDSLSQFRQDDLFSSIKESLKSNSVTDKEFKIYSETLLINLPTPDFSMPYNVICLTCTVVAIAFGSIHNFTTRKFKFLQPKSPKEKLKALLVKLNLIKQ